MNNKAVYNIVIMKLDTPVYVAGRGVRVKHGTPECFPAINALITKFHTDDIASQIRYKKEPVIRFGLCIGHIYYENIIEFTYITGVQISEPAEESRLPEATKCYTIPAGDYACIKVTSPDAGATIYTAYTRLEQWIKESPDWETTTGEYEVYPNVSTNAEMELWRPIKRIGQL